MTTLSAVTNVLKKRGYTADFSLKPTHLVCKASSQGMYPNEFMVDKHYRFEGSSDPADEAILFAISSPKHNLKGVLICGYGVSSEDISKEMMKALDEKKV